MTARPQGVADRPVRGSSPPGSPIVRDGRSCGVDAPSGGSVATLPGRHRSPSRELPERSGPGADLTDGDDRSATRQPAWPRRHAVKLIPATAERSGVNSVQSVNGGSMSLTGLRWGLRVAALASLVVLATPPIAGQSGAKNGEWTTYGGDLGNTRYAPLDQINAGQLQQARSGVAIQDREPRSAARVPVRVDAADGARRGLLDRRHPASGGRARRGHRRADVDAQRARRARAPRRRRASSPAAACRTGPTAATSGFSTSRPAIG